MAVTGAASEYTPAAEVDDVMAGPTHDTTQPEPRSSAPVDGPRVRQLWRSHRGPLAILAAGALLPLARVVLDPLGSLPGLATGDVYKHAWPYWHTLDQLFGGQWPRTEMLAGPDGGVLLDVMLLPALAMAPVTLIAGPVAAANLWVWLSLLASGVATYALGRRLSGSVAGATAAGLVVQTAPCLVGYALVSGVHERLALWLFPTLVLLLLRCRDRGGWRWPAALGATLAAGAIHCPNYGLFACILLAFVVPVLAWPSRRGGPGLRWLLPTGVALGLGLAVVVLALQWMIRQPDFLADVGMQRVELSPGSRPVYEAATLADMLNPVSARTTRSSDYEDEIYFLPYIGWVPLLAMLAGAALAWRGGRRRSAALAGCGLVFGVLAAGPTLRSGGVSVPEPLFLALVELVPFYGQTPGTWQQVAVLVSVGGAGVALAIGALGTRRHRRMAAVALVALTLVERLWALPVPLVTYRADARVSSAYDAVGDGGVLADVPRFWTGRHLTPGPAFLAQTRHERPITYAIDFGLSPWDGVRVLMGCESPGFALSAGCIRQGGIRWVAVHRDWFDESETAASCVAGFQSVAGDPVADDGQLALFDLDRLERLPPADLCAETLARESTSRFQDRELRHESPPPVPLNQP